MYLKVFRIKMTKRKVYIKRKNKTNDTKDVNTYDTNSYTFRNYWYLFNGL